MNGCKEVKRMDSKGCLICAKENLSKNEVGLNKKLLGRKISSFYCIDCLAEHFGVTVGEMHTKIEDFKSRGCKMFE